MTMKKVMTMMVLAVSASILQCCSTDDSWTDDYNGANMMPTTNDTTTGATTTGSSELTTFDVSIDRNTAEPAATVAAYYPDEEDNLANNEFTTKVSIDLSNPVAKTVDGVTISVDKGHVTANHGSVKSVCYQVSGTTQNGSLTIVGDKKYEVVLNSVSINNPDSAALNLLSDKRAFVVLQGTSTLADGTSSKSGHKGALYCKGKLLFNGSGSLEVEGNYNNAIHSADYIVFGTGNNIYARSTANHGIKANDGIFINGGILNVEVSAATAKGINSESNIQVNGGRINVIASGSGAYEDGEAKGAAAMKCDSTFTQNGGEINLKATGNGGKGLDADWEAYINDGTLRIVTTGSTYTSGRDTSSPKGIKAGTKNVHGALNIYGGNVMVRTQGNGGEGIESKGTLSIDNANVLVSAYDDAINSAGDMHLMGGNVTAIGQHSDGIDANGNMYISGGTIVAYGASGAESGIDTGEQYRLTITGGNILAIGGRIDANISNATQGVASTMASLTANATVTVNDGSTTLASFTLPAYSYQNGTVLLSATGMKSGSSYNVSWGGTKSTVTAGSSIGNSMGGQMHGPHF